MNGFPITRRGDSPCFAPVEGYRLGVKSTTEEERRHPEMMNYPEYYCGEPSQHSHMSYQEYGPGPSHQYAHHQYNMVALDSQMSSPTQDEVQMPRRARNCAVCGDSPAKVHYGVLACFGCKGFFRRAVKDGRNKYVCRYEKSCPVNKYERNSCRYCRFRRCLQVGMNPDSVRPDRGQSRSKVSRMKLKATLSKKKSLGRTSSIRNIPEDMDDWTKLLPPEQRTLLLDLTRLSKEVAHDSEESFDTVADFSLKSLIADRSLARNYRMPALPSTSFDTSLTAMWRIVSVVDWVEGLTKIIDKDRMKMTISVEDKVSMIQNSFCELTILSLVAHVAASPSQNDNNAIKAIIEQTDLHYPVKDLARRLTSDLLGPFRTTTMSDSEFILLRAIIALNPDAPNLCNTAVARLREARAQIFDVLMKTIKRSRPKNGISPSAQFGQLMSILVPLRHICGDISTHLLASFPRPPPSFMPFLAIRTDLFNPEVTDLVLAVESSESEERNSVSSYDACNISNNPLSNNIDSQQSSQARAELFNPDVANWLNANLSPKPCQQQQRAEASAVPMAHSSPPLFAPPPMVQPAPTVFQSDIRSAFQQPLPVYASGHLRISQRSDRSYAWNDTSMFQMPPPPISRPNTLTFSPKLPLQLTKSIEEILRPAGMAEDSSFINRPLNPDWAESGPGMSTPVFNREVVAQFFPEMAEQMNAG